MGETALIRRPWFWLSAGMSRLQIAGWALVALIALIALASIHPPLTLQPFLAQLIALRSFMVVGWALVGLLLILAALLVRLHARRTGRPTRRTGLRCASLAAVLVLVALIHGGILLGRGTSLEAPAAAGQETITVLSLNTEREDATIQDVAEAAASAGADVIVLPETTAAYGERLAARLTEGGATNSAADTGTATAQPDDVTAFTVFSAVSPPLYPGAGEVDPVDATTVLVSQHLGEYRQVEGPSGAGRGLVMLEPTDGSGPVIAGAHTYPPVPGYMSLWRSSLSAVAAICQDPPAGLILAGDLNATRDHAPLRSLHQCASAGEQAGIGGLATWPTFAGNRLLGATIDHVLIDDAAWQGTSGEVITVPGTDHRGVVVRVTAR